jgi:hypothetical protein
LTGTFHYLISHYLVLEKSHQFSRRLKIMKFLSLAILLSFLSLGCEQKEESSTQAQGSADRALRGLLNVGSLSATVESPDSAQLYRVTTLEFVDGRLIKRGGMSQGSAGSEIGIEFLWNDNGEVLVTPGGFSRSSKSDFWSQTNARHDVILSAQPPKFGDFEILSFAHSYEMRSGKVENTSDGDFGKALKERKYVGALAIVHFSSREEAEEFMEKPLPIGELAEVQGY